MCFFFFFFLLISLVWLLADVLIVFHTFFFLLFVNNKSYICRLPFVCLYFLGCLFSLVVFSKEEKRKLNLYKEKYADSFLFPFSSIEREQKNFKCEPRIGHVKQRMRCKNFRVKEEQKKVRKIMFNGQLLIIVLITISIYSCFFLLLFFSYFARNSF